MPVSKEYIRVPYGMTVHGNDEIAAVNRVLNTSTQMGPHVSEFEEKIACCFGKKHGIGVNSGSSALMLAVEILNLPNGSEVITPALTFSTTVSCLLKNNLIPVYVDVAPDTYCINVDQIEAAIGPKTRAICAPNLIGNVARWDLIKEIAEKHKLKIIEDSADTLGATLNGTPTGVFSDVSITSFYGSHVINCAGNGGMLCVDDASLMQHAKLLRSWGRSSSLYSDSEAIENRFDVDLDGIAYDKKFVFEAVGYNLEPSELGAAFGLVQLDKLERNIVARQKNFKLQMEFFSSYLNWFTLPQQTPESKTGWLAFPLIVKEEAPFTRQDMQVFLEKRNIQTRVVFTGNIMRQPGFRDTPRRTGLDSYAEADRVMHGGILLACHHGLTEEMLAHVHESFTIFASHYQ